MTELKTVLATHEHLLTADVPTHGQRLLDTLNDRSTDFLRVTNVQLVQRDGAGCVATVPAAAIRKAQIGLAIPASEAHEARDKRLACFVQKREYDAILLVLGYVVRGRLQLRDTEDPVAALCHELQTFFPIPHARVSLPGLPDDVKAKVVMVNSSFVSFFHFDAPNRGRA